MTIELPELVERARERTIAVAFALAGSSMLAASLVFADIVMRIRSAGHIPVASRPPVQLALLVTVLLVLMALAFGAVAPGRGTARRVRRWRVYATVALGLCVAAVECRASFTLARVPDRDVFGAIAAALLAWHALHPTIASVATLRALSRGPSAFAAPALLWNFAAFSWIVLAAVLWLV